MDLEMGKEKVVAALAVAADLEGGGLGMAVSEAAEKGVLEAAGSS